MYRRHLLQKQVEEFAQLMSKLKDVHKLNQLGLAREIMNDAYKAYLNQEGSVLKRSSFLTPDKIQEKFSYKNEQMEILARLFFEEAEKLNEEVSYAKTALLILQYLNLKQKFFSFEREDLIVKIEKFLSEA